MAVEWLLDCVSGCKTSVVASHAVSPVDKVDADVMLRQDVLFLFDTDFVPITFASCWGSNKRLIKMAF
jgi:hypothetical protein